MSNSEERKKQDRRKYSERLGEERGDRYLRNKGYTRRLGESDKGMAQGHDAVYDDRRTRSAELNRSAQIIRNRDRYSRLQVREAQRHLRKYRKDNGYIPNNKSETVVAEFKGGSSKESKLQEQPDWAINVAKDIRDGRGAYKKASPKEREVANEVLEAHKEGSLRYEVVTTNHKGETKQTRNIKPAEHDGLYDAKSQRGLNNIDTLKTYRERLKEANEHGDTKEIEDLKRKINKHLKRRKEASPKQKDNFKHKEKRLLRQHRAATNSGDREKVQKISKKLREHYQRRIQGAIERGDAKEQKSLTRKQRKYQPPQTVTKKRGR